MRRHKSSSFMSWQQIFIFLDLSTLSCDSQQTYEYLKINIPVITCNTEIGLYGIIGSSTNESFSLGSYRFDSPRLPQTFYCLEYPVHQQLHIALLMKLGKWG